jgi:2-C-methyl-D-erythritol 4-phosphate cytidylyltransferase
MGALAVIVAAGRGERMGAGVPKAFLPLGGIPMLVHSARVFDAAASVSALAVVVPEARLDEARALLRSLAKPTTVAAGGERRQDSVRAGVATAPGFDGIVLVHDAARPLVDAELVDAVVAAAGESGAAIPILPVTDTIKRVEHGVVLETLDRAALGAAQTPQGFDAGLLRRALEAADRDGAVMTDEAAAVERTGAAVRAVRGSAENRKITTPEDLAWAEDVLRRRGAVGR